jgi:hypothetical protein
MRFVVLSAAALLSFGAACQSAATQPTHIQSPAAGLVNPSPLCHGVHLLASRQRSGLAVYSWQRFGDGYRPAPTGLIGSRAVAAVIERPQFDAPNDYAILLTFTGADADLLQSITQAASSRHVSAQPVPPDGFIGIFVGLTDSDIASWDSVQSRAMQPVSQGGKLVSNPVVLEPVASGMLIIFVGGDLQTGCSLTAAGE